VRTIVDSGDVVLVAFPFTDAKAVKRRPALVLLASGNRDLLLARITGRAERSVWDVPVTAWSAAGLLAPSVIRLDKLATLQRTLIERRLGRLSAADRGHVRTTLRKLLERVTAGLDPNTDPHGASEVREKGPRYRKTRKPAGAKRTTTTTTTTTRGRATLPRGRSRGTTATTTTTTRGRKRRGA
jgi:mRNA interferase MazF